MGDKCSVGDLSADEVLVTIFVVYLVIFFLLALSLRHSIGNVGFDNFYIREELKITAYTAMLPVLPWWLFNKYWTETNLEIFPFSTFFLLVSLAFVFSVSTIWPLYRSIWSPQAYEMFTTPEGEQLTSLKGVLDYAPARESFKNFLALEFSPENLGFYLDVEKFRAQKKEHNIDPTPETEDKDFEAAKRIFEKYVAQDAQLQVNLPFNIVNEIDRDIHLMHTRTKKKSVISMPPSNIAEQHGDGTVFDIAQRDIFELMERDTLPRFFASELYKTLLDKTKEETLKMVVLAESGLVDGKKQL